MNNLSFRPARVEDIAALSALAERIWKAWYVQIISLEQVEYMLAQSYSGSSLRQQMEEKQHQFHLAFVGTDLVGYASMSSENGQDYFLHKFYVDTTLHRKGIGAAFLKYLEQCYQPKTIRLTVNRMNFTSINFYFRNGFIIERVADFDIGNGYFMNDFVMVKK